MRLLAKYLLVTLLAWPMVGHAQLLYSYSGLSQSIPDGDPTGLVNVQDIANAPGMLILDLNVNLTISGAGGPGFNGDLMVTLQHDNGYAVLLNRPGARTGASYGYGDSGLSITLDDGAANDVHVYRQVLNGDHTTPLGGSLTGAWKPDGRTTDPATVTDGSTRTAFLDSFFFQPVNGRWNLFVTDLSSGAAHRLESWEMVITAVPEPQFYACACGAALLLFAAIRRRLDRKPPRNYLAAVPKLSREL